MKVALIAVGAILGLLVVTAVGFALSYIGWSNDANKFEADIPAQFEQMKNVYDNGWKQVMETAQVPENRAEDMQTVWHGVMQDRYGADGSKAMLQLIQESNPNIDASLYAKVQEQIEEFHSTFSASQTRIISQKQSYNVFLSATTSGRLYNFIGHYPHLHFGIPVGSQDDYAILTSDKTVTDFAKHKSDALVLRPKK